MNQAPQISIVIPVFNAERFIHDCLESVLQSKFEDFELILVDDCSIDRSAEIARSFKDPRIKIFRTLKNSGESFARNFGISLARGKYIYIMDDDDLILPDLLAVLYIVAEDTQAEIVYTNSWYETREEVNLSGNIVVAKYDCNNPEPREISSNLMDRLRDEYMRRDVEVPPWMKIQRRDFLLRHGIYFPPVTRDGDGLFNFAELCHAKNALVVDGAGYLHRNYSKQTMGAPVEIQVKRAIESLPEMIRFMNEFMQKFPREIQPIDRLSLLQRQMIHMFRVFVVDSYKNGLSREQLDSILRENMSTLISEDLVRIMFHSLSEQILMNDKNRGDSKKSS